MSSPAPGAGDPAVWIYTWIVMTEIWQIGWHSDHNVFCKHSHLACDISIHITRTHVNCVFKCNHKVRKYAIKPHGICFQRVDYFRIHPLQDVNNGCHAHTHVCSNSMDMLSITGQTTRQQRTMSAT